MLTIDAMETIIYGLCDPDTKQLRYVGKTTRTLEARLRAHLRTTKRFRTHNGNWIRGLVDTGKRPDAFCIEVVAGDGNEAEAFWIAQMRALGCRLTNATAGGDGLFQPSEATRLKMRNAQLGKKRGPKTEAQLAAARATKGIKRTDAHRAVLSAIHKKMPPLSAERRAKMVAALRSPEVRARMSAQRSGIKPSRETVEKQRAGLRAYWARRKASSGTL